MPINFQTLSPIQPAQGVVATLPQQSSPLSQLGTGIQNAVANMQQTQNNEQTKQINDLKIEGGQLDLQEKKRQLRSAEEIRAAAKQGRDSYVQALMQEDPAAAMDYLTKEKDVEFKAANILLTKQQAQEKQVGNAGPIIMDVASVVNTAETWTDPKTGQGMTPEQKTAFIAGGLKLIGPEAEKWVQAIAPNGYDQNTAMAIQHLAQLEAAKEAEKRDKSQPSDTTKRITELNESRKAQGLAPLTAEETAKIQKAAIDKSTAPDKGQYRPANEEIGMKVAENRLSKDNEDAKTHRSNIDAAKVMRSLANATDSGSTARLKITLSNLGNSLFGIPIDPKTPANETYNMVAKAMQINLQSLMKGQTSDRDMVIMQEASPQLTNTAPGKKLMADIMEYRGQQGLNQIAFENAWVNKYGNLDGMDDAWSNFIASRQDITKKEITDKSGKVIGSKFEFNTPTRKDWAPYLDRDNQPVNKKPEVSSQFENGKVYQDANGNKATFNNGKWEPVQ